jgi:hypothetical protein
VASSAPVRSAFTSIGSVSGINGQLTVHEIETRGNTVFEHLPA